jgi:hypothetical protein
MRRCAVELVVEFLAIFAVVALLIGKAKQPLFDDRIFFVPQPQRKTKNLLIVAYAGNAFLAPAVGFAPGRVMGNKIPGITLNAVIFPHGSPLSFSKIGSEFSPVLYFVPIFNQALFLSSHVRRNRGLFVPDSGGNGDQVTALNLEFRAEMDLKGETRPDFYQLDHT